MSFDVTPSRVYQIVKANMQELDESIHPHALRSYRVTHLSLHYEFTPYDLVSFAGESQERVWLYRVARCEQHALLSESLVVDV